MRFTQEALFGPQRLRQKFYERVDDGMHCLCYKHPMDFQSCKHKMCTNCGNLCFVYVFLYMNTLYTFAEKMFCTILRQEKRTKHGIFTP